MLSHVWKEFKEMPKLARRKWKKKLIFVESTEKSKKCNFNRFMRRMRSFINWIIQLFSGRDNEDTNDATLSQNIRSNELTEETHLVDPSTRVTSDSHTISNENFPTTSNYFADVGTSQTGETVEKQKEKSDSSSIESIRSKSKKNKKKKSGQEKIHSKTHAQTDEGFEPVKSRKSKSQSKNSKVGGSNQSIPAADSLEHKEENNSENSEENKKQEVQSEERLTPPPLKPREEKESKKVDSNITYAQIASQHKQPDKSEGPSGSPLVDRHSKPKTEEKKPAVEIDEDRIEHKTAFEIEQHRQKEELKNFDQFLESFVLTNPTPSTSDEHCYANNTRDRVREILRHQSSQSTTEDVSSSVFDDSSKSDEIKSKDKEGLEKTKKASFDSTDISESSSSNKEVNNPVEEKLTETVDQVQETNRSFPKPNEVIEEETSEDIRVVQSVEVPEVPKETNIMPVRTSEDPRKYPMKEKDEIKDDVQVRILNLNDQDFQESTIYKLEKNWIIEFRLGPSLFGRHISIYCNYPLEKNGKLDDFVRNNYRVLQWEHDDDCENADDTSLKSRIVCKLSGSFRFYYTNADERGETICGSGYFLVDPEIKYGNDKTLPLDCIQCQTIISKHLKSFTTWENKLRVTKESGYNMIHFTPVQELGKSNSAYCLQDQLQLNPSFKKNNGEMITWDEVKHFVHKIKKEWELTSICDIVLNHTANESVWVKEHPEVAYNCLDCKYMRPAYLLDAALHHFSMDVKNGLYETKGIPPVIDSEDHLNAINYHLREGVFRELKLHELFICDVNKYVTEFMDRARQSTPGNEPQNYVELQIIQDPEYRRSTSSIDMDLALKIYNIYRPGCFDEDSRLRKCCEEFKQKLDSLNNDLIRQMHEHLEKAISCTVSGIRYWRVSYDGPRLTEITESNPLTTRYFTDYGNPTTFKEAEDIMYSENSKYLMAHNGWVMDIDPLENFAGPQSNVYIRRELIAWGDSVKLRYGEKPSDCPFLWEQMRKYVEITAAIFDGVRLDNCHSTPLHVAEYLLDCARKIRPDLYVVAELFTNSDMKDNIFVNRLGITSLVREAMSAHISYEQGRLVYRFGGIPVGSFYQPNVRPLVPSIAHALFYDLTHDNESAIEKRSTFNLLPSSALVNMACCGSGSNRGYDELVPHHISVVEETREYTEWIDSNTENNPKYTSLKSGIIEAKRALNNLHFKLGLNGFNQVYVDQMDNDIVAVTRHCPKTHQSYILVAFTAYNHPGEHEGHRENIKPLFVEGVLDEIVLETTLSHLEYENGASKYARPTNFTKDANYINGFSEYKIDIKQNIQLSESEILEQQSSTNIHGTELRFKNFKPGSIVVIKVSLPQATAEAVKDVRKLTEQFSFTKPSELNRIIKKLSLSDLNRVLYRCDQEERDDGCGFDTYDIPNYGKLVYAGLQGFISVLSKIRPNNDTGHPMCDNLRQGNWMIEYIYRRLRSDKNTEELSKWIKENTASLRKIPRYLVPAYFDLVFTGLYTLLIHHAHQSMSEFVSRGSIFVKYLSMGSIQFAAYVKSADLPVLSPNLAPPKPPTKLNHEGKEVQACVSLSAGLPHFSVGYTRNWGRDTFIAFRGMFILTGRYQEARYHILAYGACLRHGLIPNLLDGGRNSRFNCRDAVWWWLYCIKCYTEDVPDGLNILDDKVSRIFPTDESQPQQPGETDQILQDVIQEALNRHFQGLLFMERNAGRMIDEHMKDAGFKNQIGVHPETGFVFGGNADNCGTWMDKMGSSDKAGNRGKPATPRDGSACEIVGLSKCVVSWLAKLYETKNYKYEGVERKHANGNVTKWSFQTWSDKIKENFEKYFWVNMKPTEGEIRPDLINKRGIYKDCYGASQDWTDFQLRCNFPIVMVVAPELFDPHHAWIALKTAEKYLLGPLGMKTLDPSDWAYRGDYDNSNDSSDFNIAHGFNYHQGPEWVWPIGFFLRAKLHFAKENNHLKETINEVKYKLSNHFTELQSSDWKGLPELTNSNGSYCRDSSRTQAWSMSSVLEVLYDLQKIESSIRK